MKRRSYLGIVAGAVGGAALYLLFSTRPLRQENTVTLETTRTLIKTETITTTLTATKEQTRTVTQTQLQATRTYWVVGEPLPTPLTEVAMVSSENRLYLAGGLTADGKASDKFFSYDFSAGRWAELVPMPAGLHHVGMVYFAGSVYVVGGYDGGWNAQNKVYRYEVRKDVWEEMTPMPTARGALTAQPVDGLIYAVGGARNNLPLNTNEAFNPSSNEWMTRRPMRVAREHLASGVFGERFFAVGGRVVRGGGMTNLDVVEVYDVESDVWSVRSPMPTARSGIAAAVVGGKLYVFGGESQVKTFSEVEAYDPKTDTWEKVAELPTPRHGLGVAAVGNRIYVVAGGPQPGLTVSSVNEVLVLEG
jgi:hypothetical protein